MTKQMYDSDEMNDRKDGWAGYQVMKALRGWKISYWSRIQGATTGQVLLIPYDRLAHMGYSAETNLRANHNDHMIVAEYIAEYAKDNKDDSVIEIIKKGFEVQ